MVVVLVGRREEKLAGVAREIEAAGGEAFVLPADVSKAETPQEIVEQVLSLLGRIDVLINNAAGLLGKPVDPFTLAGVRAQGQTNVTKVFFLYQLASPRPVP